MNITNQILIDRLTAETQSLKIQYIEFITDFSKKEYIQYTTMTRDQLLKNYGDFDERENRYFATKKSQQVFRFILKLKRMSMDEYVSQNVIDAIDHYTLSIQKLADRLSKKGLDINNLKMQTTHIGVNIETIITDGVKKVKAQTILAYGDVQRPHYRYLVK